MCVPAIFWTVTALVASLPFPFHIALVGVKLDWAMVASALVSLYYLFLSIPLMVGMSLWTALCVLLTRQWPVLVPSWPLWQGAIVIFVVAWTGQFIGHAIEGSSKSPLSLSHPGSHYFIGKKPSFFEDVQFLMVGPVWLMHFIFKKVGIPY